MQYFEPQSETTSLENTVLETIKDFVRDELTTKAGKMKTDATGATGNGTRGMTKNFPQTNRGKFLYSHDLCDSTQTA